VGESEDEFLACRYRSVVNERLGDVALIDAPMEIADAKPVYRDRCQAARADPLQCQKPLDVSNLTSILGILQKSMSADAQAEILAASTAPATSESGGSYGQKGVDFQRYWAISRIIELVSESAPDFLILFESLQDVVEFDNSTTPTRAKVYQLKMKGTGEWSWHSLTALPLSTPRKKKGSAEVTTPRTFQQSPIGKLAATVAELSTIEGEGIFVSNLGCAATLQAGSTAGSLRICKFSELSDELQAQIRPELGKLKKPIPLSALHLHKTELSLDEPETHVAGKMVAFLAKEAPKHVGQCKSFSDSLFAILSARGRTTEPPENFADLVRRRGYSKSDFSDAVDQLRDTPNQQELVNSWLSRLTTEKMPLRDYTRMQIELMRKIEERLRNGTFVRGLAEEAAHAWVTKNPVGNSVLEFLQAAELCLAPQFPQLPKASLQALILLEGIAECLNQI
jgi:hypothetical protein